MSAHPRGSAAGNQWSKTGREMLTVTGRMVPLDAFKPEHVDLQDIAFGLGGFRFGNQHPARVTIAQHSVAVMRIVQYWLPRASDRLLRNALLHDAHEAYTQDLVGAVKLIIRAEQACGDASYTPEYDGPYVGAFDRLGDTVQAAIEERFDCAISPSLQQIIGRADKAACAYELRLGGWHMDAPYNALVDGVLTIAALYSCPSSFRDACSEVGL